MVVEQAVATRPNLPRARSRPERFRDDEQWATNDDDDDDEHLDYGEAEPILNKASKTGYFGVTVRSDRHVMPHPFQARVRSGDRMLALGSFATAEKAARVAAGCVRHLRGKQAGSLCQPPHEESVPPPPPPPPLSPPPPPPPPPSLIKSKIETATGYFGVSRCPSQGKRGQAPRYQAKVLGAYLGRFVTPEAAARAIAVQYPDLVLAQQEEAAQQTRARSRPKTPQRKTGPRSRGGGAATRRAAPKPTSDDDADDAETDVTDDDLLVDPDVFFAFEDVEDEPLPPPPPPKPAMTCRVVDALRHDMPDGLATTFTFGSTNLGRRSFSFSPPPPPPAPTLKRLLDFDGAITAYAQIKKKRSAK